MFSFRCSCCGELHEGVPSFGWDYPIPYLDVPEADRITRCHLTSDICVIDGQFFFVRGCLEVPVLGQNDPLSWGVWASLSERNFAHFQELYDEPKRAHHGPFFGWLSAHIWIYPDTVNLKTKVHLRDDGIRPYVELEPTDHPLAVEQHQGITPERVAEIYEMIVHGSSAAG